MVKDGYNNERKWPCVFKAQHYDEWFKILSRYVKLVKLDFLQADQDNYK